MGNVADDSFDGIAGEFVADGDYIFFGPDNKWHKSPVPDDVDLDEYARLDGANFTGNITAPVVGSSDFLWAIQTDQTQA